ncbi:MAG: AIR synthase-related protein, partial [Thermobifida fusca]|nr:AIR synthase-related protein [Thermobifida fusca]
RASWAPPAVFGFLARHGQVSQEDMEATFNMGVGMVAIVAEDAAERALELLAERGVPAWVLGSVIPGSGKVVMTGEYRS